MRNCAIKNNSAYEDNKHSQSNVLGSSRNTYTKRIGSTTYVVTVNFSNTSQETAQDNLLRLIKREVENLV